MISIATMNRTDRKHSGRILRGIPGLLLVTGFLLATAGGAWCAETADAASFLRAEYQVLGRGASTLPAAAFAGVASSATLSRGRAFDQVGGQGMERRDEIGGGEAEPEDSGPTNLGTKFKAGLLSAVLPGAGQYYNGNRSRAYLMGSIEVAIWGAWFVFDNQGDNWKDTATDYADIYAGTSGEHSDSYWIAVGTYMESDDYDEARLREARALQEPAPDLTVDADAWLWVNNERRLGYWRLWGDAHDAYDRRDYMLLFALVNRVVSVVDAVLGVDGRPDGVIETGLLDLGVGVDLQPSGHDPMARCVVSRRF